jgi:hypothetical protein
VRGRRSSSILALALSLALAGLTFTACAARQPVDLAGGCGTTAAERLDSARTQAERWLRLTDVTPRPLYDAPAAPPPSVRLPADGVRRLAVISYASVHPGSPLHGRSFLYDDALALLWYGATGDEAAARGLAATLLALQNPDGTWGFVLGLRDGYYNASYVRAGTVAWVAHALAVHGRRFADPAASAAAMRGVRALQSRQRAAGAGAGLVEGGRGRWAPDEKAFHPEFRLREAVTEHQLDLHMALASLQHPDAAVFSERILASLWLEPEGRFAVAAGDGGVDPARALDAAGAWGALWLLARGDVDRARRSLRYTVETFPARTQDLVGFRPQLDPIEGPLSALEVDLIFVEGTLGVGLAAHRLGEAAIAERALSTAVELACRYGPGVPYANRPARNFVVEPAAAPTFWFLFFERELRTGLTAPLWPPASPR